MAAKHVPLRTCAGCARKVGKRELVRVVRTGSGGVQLDATGKAAGRGAYLCSDPACWEASLKRGRLEHALKVKLPTDAREALRAIASELVAATNKGEAIHG
jgi:predicted RNA-binding protein YlxR (DUF448 family)